MGSNIMKNSCWVIKVTYLNKKEINFNEAYWTLDKCLAAMRSKIEFEDAIQKLLSHGIAWSDEQNFIKSETKNDDVIYWFPGIIGKS